MVSLSCQECPPRPGERLTARTAVKGGRIPPPFSPFSPTPRGSRLAVCSGIQTWVCQRFADTLLSVNPPPAAGIRNRQATSEPMNGRNAGRAPAVLTLSGNRGVAKIRPRQRWQWAGGLTAARDDFAGPFCNDSAGPSRNVYRREAGSAAHPRRGLRAPRRRGRRGESA
jgi:hypothetical protein